MTKPVSPTLVAVAHGTKDADGIAQLRRLCNVVRTKLPGVAIELCFVDVVEPRLAGVLEALRGPAVVVPLLLATGHHVKSDIPSAVGDRPRTIVTAPIGPDERVSGAVQARLEQARAAFDWDEDEPREDEVVVMAAGSSDPEARLQLAAVGRQLEAWNSHHVTIAQLTDKDPFARLSPTVQVATYLLSSGHFNDKLRGQTAEHVVGEPIGAHPLVAEVIVERYLAGVSALG
ncbi:sirohydrochlorin chelatase [Jatrophihabitans sp. DSM 45814]